MNGTDNSGTHDHGRGGFARWLLRQYRLAGHDPAGTDDHVRIVVIAAIALDTGLTPELTTELVHTLAVTPQDVRAAYLAESRRRTLDKLLDHPDLTELDHHLDEIAPW
ncbi:hypothetical protein AB0N81_07890 [Streptomyces sp. NPDC093510]|uniref:hypothetical protein n=1 Tax=Streptomyces sp. NPDC093510 TaxID=3155199 RepID=UPI00343E1B5D